MPAPSHYRITYSGTLGVPGAVGSEEWSCNVSFKEPTGLFLVRSDLPALATAVRGPWVTNVMPKLSNAVALTRVRVASVGATGLVPRDSSGAYIQGDDVTASFGSGTVYLPYQLALAVSWHSAFSGPNGRGRIFLPMPTLGTITSDGLLPTSTRDAFTTSMKTYADAVNVALNSKLAGMRLCIASAGSPSKGISPGLRDITGVSVGRVVDTQRRRRGQLLEARTITALA